MPKFRTSMVNFLYFVVTNLQFEKDLKVLLRIWVIFPTTFFFLENQIKQIMLPFKIKQNLRLLVAFLIFLEPF